MGQIDINPKLYYVIASDGTEILCKDLAAFSSNAGKFNNCRVT
jgi:hypothetical protein